MSWRKKLIMFLGFWTGVGLLVRFGGRSNAADHLLIAIWFAILIVGSAAFLFQKMSGKPTKSELPPTLLSTLLPRRWQYWIFGETPPEDKKKDGD